MVERYETKRADEALLEDLERYRDCLINWGASDAEIIPSDDVIIDIRVRAQCHFACDDFGSNANCPPYVFSLDQARELIGEYRYGIIFKLDLPPELIAGEITDDQNKKRREYALKRYELIGRLELEAFDDGYPFALGFSGGPCLQHLCSGQECRAIKEGKVCRHPFLARPSMEALGMDVYTMATEAGWDVYPIGSHTSPDDVGQGQFVGMVMID